MTPYIPVDSHLCVLLYSKLNAFGNEKVIINELRLETTKDSFEIGYMFNSECFDEQLPEMNEWVGKHYHTYPWWKRNDLSTYDLPYTKDDDIKVPPKNEKNFDIIDDLYLTDDDSSYHNENNNAKVIKPKFDKNKNGKK